MPHREPSASHEFVAHPAGDLRRCLVLVALLSSALHLAWEWAQCAPYFIHRPGTATPGAMLVATLGDLVLTALAYALVAAIHGPRWPLRRWSPGIWGTLMGLALVLSLAVETLALRMGRWAYTDMAPLIPGTAISVLPVAQLLLLFPLCFGLAGALALRAADPRSRQAAQAPKNSP